ncbi:MAG TPA: hypothetical protein PKI32_00290 [Opitutales bacterium]|nr:hypothetical protein [Opitutales bacterium]
MNSRIPLAVFLLLAFPFFCAAAVPTPRQAVSADFGVDSSTQWVVGYSAGNESSVIMELVPKGETVENWSEIVTNRIMFYADPVTVEQQVEAWKAMLGPTTEVQVEKLDDGSCFATYSSKAHDEFGMYHFFPGEDGVYEIGFAEKLSKKNEDRVALWRSILMRAKLVPNPLLKK